MAWTRNVYHTINQSVSGTTVRRLIIAFVLFIIPVLLFAYIGRQVLQGDTTAIDTRILLGIYHRSSATLDTVVLTMTDLGSAIAVLAIGTGVVALYATRRRWRACAQIIAGIGGAGLLNIIIKLLFERNRPNLWHHLVFESSYSFPSGHAMLSSALAFTIVALAWHTKWRLPAIAGGALYMAGIAFTRLYLGVHYPTDIIAAWCVSLAWVVLVGIVLGAVVVPHTSHRAVDSKLKQ
ncbi:MAG: phosphatase PAP2 family protein [Candidatus Saccharimonadales bacterium]